MRPTQGEIWVDGVDIAELSEQELPLFRARRFGFIFQDFNLLAALSAEENVEVTLNLAGSHGPTADARARQPLDDLGLGARLDFGADQLSGSEKQRVAVARAIANRPQLILADEPTANLDSQRGQETMRLLRRLATFELQTRGANGNRLWAYRYHPLGAAGEVGDDLNVLEARRDRFEAPERVAWSPPGTRYTRVDEQRASVHQWPHCVSAGGSRSTRA